MSTPPFIVDAHEDIAFNALSHGRDVRRSVAETRALEREHPIAEANPFTSAPQLAMLGLPEHRRGGVGLVFATIYVPPGELRAMTAAGRAQVQYYASLVLGESGVRLINTRTQLETLLYDWTAAREPEACPVGLVLLMEGADPLGGPQDLAAWYRRGLRIVGPAWRGTRYAGGTRAPGPLTDLGRGLLAEMQRLGVILDVSHLAEESFWQALDAFSGPVLASHSNCRAFVPTDRQLSDDMIRALAARDAVIGTVLANPFLVAGWTSAAGPVPLDAVVRHVDHIAQLTGTSRHCAIGSDFDGGFGAESTPAELDSIADMGKLADALARHGYTADDIAGILGGNWLRLLRASLPA
jgi:membrane dipeptidase